MKPFTISLCVILAACNGGGGTAVPAPVASPTKTPYELWLEAGNVGTEQDYLDSLVSGGGSTEPEKPAPDVPNAPYNWHTRLTNEISNGASYFDISEQKIPWGPHDTYAQYKYSKNDTDEHGQNVTHHWTYYEKELTLGNYMIFENLYEYEDGRTLSVHSPLLQKRYDKQYYDTYYPDAGTIFNGGTFAFVTSGSDKLQMLTGAAQFKYDPQRPELKLAFDNYYTITLKALGNYLYDVHIDGQNSTGEDAFYLPTGEYKHYIDWRDGIGTKTFLAKDDVVEGFVEYDMHFDSNYNITGDRQVNIQGIFGGTKQ